MDAQVIPFPAARGPRAPAIAVGSGIVPEPQPIQEGEPVVMVTLELRRLVHTGMPLSYGAESALRRRCARAGLEALATEGEEVRLSGSGEWPAIEATFSGEGCEVTAVSAVLEADEWVRRTGGGEFVVSGAAAAGRVTRRGTATAMLGAPSAIISELVPNAAPGQVLLGGEAWERSRYIDKLPARGVELPSGTMPVFILRGTR